ncbi:MAG: hypothetical protein WC421_11000 [Elusimicrobiales bacterium]
MKKVTIIAAAALLAAGLCAMRAGAGGGADISLNYSLEYSLVAGGHKAKGEIATPEGRENIVELPNGKLSMRISPTNADSAKIDVTVYDAHGNVEAATAVTARKDREASVSLKNYAVEICALTVKPAWDYANAWRY